MGASLAAPARAPARRETDPPVRYTLLGGRIGVARRREWARTLGDAVLWLLVAPLPVRLLWRLRWRRAASVAQRWWARRVARALDLQVELDGLEVIDRRQTYLVVPLHEGFADALALLQLPLPLRFVVRDELAEWPVLGPYLRDSGQVAVCPEAGARAYRTLLRAAPAVAAAGESLVLFPQGSLLGLEIAFRRGPFALARTLGWPILPIALSGGHRVWEHPYTPRLRRGERISLRVLPPIPAEEVQARDAEELRGGLERRLKREALDGAMAAPRRFRPERDGYWPGYAYEIDPAFPNLAAEVAAYRRGLGGGIRRPRAGEDGFLETSD